MKPLFHIQRILVFGLVFVLCFGTLGTAQAGLNALTIQQMIDGAADGGTVNITTAGTYSENLLVDKNLTIRGIDLNTTILQPADAHHRVIKVTSGHNLRLEYLRVTGGHPDAADDTAGGGVYVQDGNLTLDHVQIDHNQASYGGGVFEEGQNGSVITSNAMIDDNTASFHGGGIYTAGSATLSYTNLAANSASNHGGGMHANKGAILKGGSVTGNHALYGNGGGVNVNDDLTVNGTIFNLNTAAGTSGASGSGGAITQWNSGKTVSIFGAAFNNNSAQVNGGAVYIHESFLSLEWSYFNENTVDSGSSGVNTDGGGVHAGGGLDGSLLSFTSNTAKCTTCVSTLGGGLYIQRTSYGPSSVTTSTFDGNLAWLGSGVNSDTNVQLTLANCDFINNGALVAGQQRSGYGGGVNAAWMHGDRLLFKNNKVMNYGGGMRTVLSELTNSRFINNTAGYGGGMSTNSSFTGANLLFASNESNYGAALMVQSGTAVLRHVTIGRPARGNGPAVEAASGSTLELKNSMITSYHIGIRAGGEVTEDYNLLYDNWVDYDASGGGTIHFGLNNLALKDPLFVSPAGDDYHLRWPSPAIGKGTDLGVTTDLDGRSRLGRMDIGAYQYWASQFLPLLRK